MKFNLILFFGIYLITHTGQSQTQAEMNRDAFKEFEKVDSRLDSIYKAIQIEYKTDTIFVKNLRNSQKVWLELREADAKMKYPDYPISYYGSMHPACYAFYLIELTEVRITRLQAWLDKEDKYDGCGGSIKY